jgi:hypothetical protein
MAKKQYKDEEGSMSKNELETTERSAKIIKAKIKNPDQQLPAWVQSKITKASDQISAVADYMQGSAVDEGISFEMPADAKDRYDRARKRKKVETLADPNKNPNPNERENAQRVLNKEPVKLAPKFKKLEEENTLVNQILSEMGNCNKSEKGKHCPSHGNTECPGIKKNLTVEQVAKKHRLEVGFVEKQLQAGIKIEREHTNDTHLAMSIALQHLDEIPDYYNRLKKMESGAKKEHKKYKDVKESTEDRKFCKLCNKKETRSECSYGGKAWDKYSTLDPDEIAKHSARMKKKDKNIKKHCGCEGDAVKELEDGLKKSKDNSYDSIDKLMRGIMEKYDMTAKQLHNSFKDKHNKTPDEWVKQLKETVTIEDSDGNPYVEFIDLIKPDPIKEAKKDPCWKGYTQVGMKKKGGREVPNCVPSKGVPKAKGYQKESIEEAVRIPAKTGNILAIVLSWKGKVYSVKMFFSQSKMPTRKDVVYEIQKIYPGCILRQYKVSTVGNGEPLIQVSNTKSKDYLMNIHTIGEEVELDEDWQSVNRKDKTDGLSQKAVNAYRKENPGSKLQTAVTEKKPTGKRKQRRAAFCQRMSGMKSKLTSAKTARDPDSNINKALRRWKCN